MIRHVFQSLAKPLPPIVISAALIAFLAAATTPTLAMDAVRGGALAQPLFPADNWWNLDISGGRWTLTRQVSFRLSTTAERAACIQTSAATTAVTTNGIYGIPYAVVSGANSSDLKSVQFQYWEDSDGVDLKTGAGFPFYPIPPEAITQTHWIEGGEPGNVDKRSSQDRHLLIVDRDRPISTNLQCFLQYCQRSGMPDRARSST